MKTAGTPLSRARASKTPTCGPVSTLLPCTAMDPTAATSSSSVASTFSYLLAQFSTIDGACRWAGSSSGCSEWCICYYFLTLLYYGNLLFIVLSPVYISLVQRRLVWNIQYQKHIATGAGNPRYILPLFPYTFRIPPLPSVVLSPFISPSMTLP